MNLAIRSLIWALVILEMNPEREVVQKFTQPQRPAVHHLLKLLAHGNTKTCRTRTENPWHHPLPYDPAELIEDSVQIHGRKTAEEHDDELRNALSVLVELERAKVVAALSKSLRGDLELSNSLSTSRAQAVEPDEEEADDSGFDHLAPTGRNPKTLFWVSSLPITARTGC